MATQALGFGDCGYRNIAIKVSFTQNNVRRRGDAREYL